MNPVFGAAVEGARLQEKSASEDANAAAEPEVELQSAHDASRHQQSTKQQPGSRGQEKHFNGDATYYDLPRSKTASGHPFDPNAMSAAMTGEKARLGQHVRVTYSGKNEHGKAARKSISAVIDDRGPLARDQRGKPLHPLKPDPRGVIDLTPAAFKALNASFVHDFAVIEQNETLGNTFQVRGDVVVSRDFVSERRIPVTMSEVVLRPAAK